MMSDHIMIHSINYVHISVGCLKLKYFDNPKNNNHKEQFVLVLRRTDVPWEIQGAVELFAKVTGILLDVCAVLFIYIF